MAGFTATPGALRPGGATPGLASGTATPGTGIAVTATQTGTDAHNGMALTVAVLTGAKAAAAQTGATAQSVTATTPQLAITPGTAGSLVYGAVTQFGGGTFTPAADTTFTQNVNDSANTCAYGTFRTTTNPASGAPVTVGATAPPGPAGNIDIAVAEILTLTTLTEDPSAPAPVTTATAETLTTALFTPPAGTLLIAMVATNAAGTGPMTLTVSDTSGLAWTQLVRAGASGDAYAGIWVAQVTSTVTVPVAQVNITAWPVSVPGGPTSVTVPAAQVTVQAWPAVPAAPNITVVNQWAGSYGQGTTFDSITSAFQSCVIPLTPAASVGGGSGTPTPGNWLFCVASWTQTPAIANVHIGVSDDIHSWWREYPAAGTGGNTRTAIAYTPNLARTPTCVYVAPDAEIAAVTVLIVEVNGLGPWDTVSGMTTGYAPAATSLPLTLTAPAASSFFIAAAGGNKTSAGQAIAATGWTGLRTVSQTNGADHLADSYLTTTCRTASSASQAVTVTAGTAEDLSGFALAVYTAGVSPVPANQNPAWPYMILEAGFGSGFNTPDSEITWTDISTRLWEWDETTGIQYQLGQLQSTNLTITLDNFDNALSSTNTTSPYYPDVQPGTPLRLRAALGTLGGVTANRWYVIQRNAMQWDEQIDEAHRRYVEVTCTDLWAALSSTPPTFYRSEVYEDAPYAWWPCDDQPGSAGVQPRTLLNAAIGNTNVLNVTVSPNGTGPTTAYGTDGVSSGTFGYVRGVPVGLATYITGANGGWMFGDPQGQPASLGTGNPVSSLPGSAGWETSGESGNTGGNGWFLSCHDTNFPPLSAGITVEGWFKYPYFGTTTEFSSAGIHVIAQEPYSPLTLIALTTDTLPVAVLQLDIAGHLNLITYSGATPTSHSIYADSDLRSNSQFMVTATLTATTWQVWVNGGDTAQASGTAAGMSNFTWYLANADMGLHGGGATSSVQHSGNVAVAHLAVYPCVLPYWRVMDHWWAAVTAFGQIPAPTGVTFTITQAAGAGAVTMDGQLALGHGSYGHSNTSFTFAAVVAAQAGGFTSGPSAFVATGSPGITSATDGFAVGVAWTGFASRFAVYTAASVDAETQASITAAVSDVFASGYGGAATGYGIGHLSGGSGAAPPAAADPIGDTVGRRIERLMRAGRVTSPNRSIDPAGELVVAPGTSGGGTQAGAAIQAIQESDSGFLCVDNGNKLTYWQRPHLASQYANPVWQLGPSSPEIPYYRDIKWVTDPQHIYDVIAITPLSPTGAALPTITPSSATAVNASQSRYGAQPLAITSWLQDQSKLQVQADWLFANFGVPYRRAENVKIDAAPYPAAWVMVMGVNVSDLVSAEDWQIGGGGAVGTYRVTELTRRFTRNSHDSGVAGQIILTLDREPGSYWE